MPRPKKKALLKAPPEKADKLIPYRYPPGVSGNPDGRPRILLEVALKARARLATHVEYLEQMAEGTRGEEAKDRIAAIKEHRTIATGEGLRLKLDDTPEDDGKTDLELLRELADEMGYELLPKSKGDLERVNG